MMRPAYFKEGLCVVFLCAYAMATFVPLASFRKDCDRSVARMKERLFFINSYKESRGSETLPPRYLGNIDGAQALLVLQRLSEDAGMVLENVKLDKEENSHDPGCKVTPFELSLSGPEVGLISFLSRIKEIGFVCRLACLRVKANSQEEGVVRAQIRLEKIELARPVSFKDLYGISFRRSKGPQEREDIIGKRKLFKNSAPLLSNNVHGTPVGRPDIVQDLNLVGIVDDHGMRAVLEDKKTQKTLFLGKDDTIEGLRVIDIRANEVVLQGEGATYNLVL